MMMMMRRMDPDLTPPPSSALQPSDRTDPNSSRFGVKTKRGATMSLGLLMSLPLTAERSRTKERLEASLGGLCELELLKHRQESRVRGALRLGDLPARSAAVAPDGRAPADGGAARVPPRSSLRCTPWGIMASLGQQVADLKVDAGARSSARVPACVGSLASDESVIKQDGSPEPNYNAAGPLFLSSPLETVDKETTETWLSDLMRQSTTTEAVGEASHTKNLSQEDPLTQKVETYMFGLIQRRSQPPRHSKTRTSPAHDARGAAVARQSSMCHKENKSLSNQVSSETRPSQQQEYHMETQTPEDAPPTYRQLQHQAGLYHEPRQANTVNTLLSKSYPPSRAPSTYPDSSESDPDPPQHFQNYQPAFAAGKSPATPSADEQLVSAEYIPAQPCGASSRAYAHYLSSSHKVSAVAKPSRGTVSSERILHYSEQQPSRSRGITKKCRPHEDKNGSSRKHGKKTCRSQSENSLQRAPERKYNTVERDGGAGGAGVGSGGRGSRNGQSRSKKQQEGSAGYQRCQSTVDLSQDEPEQPPAPAHVSAALNQRDHSARRTRRSQPAHTSLYAYPHHHINQQFHSHEHVEYQLDRNQGSLSPSTEDYRHHGQGESESSMSEADSPESSSSSSDSDESGGLVWPQQLSPQLSLPSPPVPPGAHLQPKAFVKIKASHALKKKILRFRTGSLKVMTTV